MTGWMRTTAAGRVAVRALIVAALLGLTGCANAPVTDPAAAAPTTTSTSAAPTTSTSAALCSAAADFQTAANALVEVDAAAVGVDGVKAVLQNLRTAGTGLADAAKAEFGPQVDALTQSLDTLGTTIDGLQDQASLSAKFGAIASSISGVEKAAAPIMDGARADCPSVPPASRPPR